MTLRKTPLYEFHQENGAKLVPFAGYEMAIQYKGGIIAEHNLVRNSCGIFDVSHMGQLYVEGQGAAEFLSNITPSDFKSLEKTVCKYTVLTNENGVS